MKKISFKRTLYATILLLLSIAVLDPFVDASNEWVNTPFKYPYQKMGNLKTLSTKELIVPKNKLDLFHWISYHLRVGAKVHNSKPNNIG